MFARSTSGGATTDFALLFRAFAKDQESSRTGHPAGRNGTTIFGQVLIGHQLS
jgi:hypothetical protein